MIGGVERNPRETDDATTDDEVPRRDDRVSVLAGTKEQVMSKKHFIVNETKQQIPKPVCEEGRICFGLMWFDHEEKAALAAKIVRERGDCYNGGWSHGQPCGRSPSFDYETKDGVKLFAVSCS
jgi:hypothetical protein